MVFFIAAVSLLFCQLYTAHPISGGCTNVPCSFEAVPTTTEESTPMWSPTVKGQHGSFPLNLLFAQALLQTEWVLLPV